MCFGRLITGVENTSAPELVAFIKSSFAIEAVRSELLAVTGLVKSVDRRLEKIGLEISEL
jgi:hypothetical protein